MSRLSHGGIASLRLRATLPLLLARSIVFSACTLRCPVSYACAPRCLPRLRASPSFPIRAPRFLLCLRAALPLPPAHAAAAPASTLHCPFCLHAALSLSLALSPGTGGGFCSPVPFFFPFSCFARVQTTTFALLYPKKADFWHIFGYRWQFLSFCTREKQISDMFSGTDGGFCLSVPFPRQISCCARVQTTTFVLLYPKKADFWHIFGYRWQFLSFCTREKQISGIFSGTNDHFCSPVPFPRQISCSARVQTTTFALLYPCAFSYSSAQSSAHLTAFCQPFRRAALVSSGIAGSKTLPSCQFAQISARSFQ